MTSVREADDYTATWFASAEREGHHGGAIPLPTRESGHEVVTQVRSESVTMRDLGVQQIDNEVSIKRQGRQCL